MRHNLFVGRAWLLTYFFQILSKNVYRFQSNSHVCFIILLVKKVESVSEVTERLEEAYQVIQKYQKKVSDLEKDLKSECARSDKLHRDYTFLLERNKNM